MQEWKKAYIFLAVSLLALITVGYAAVPQSTNPDTIQTYANGTSVGRFDYVAIDEDLFYNFNGSLVNITQVIINLFTAPANEWGLVYGTTGDWFDYQILTGATPVYINLHMHPLNETIGGEKLYPQVYDKDDTHWQLALYWANGTQYTKDDVLVMYYAHIEWTDPTGLTYIEPNEGEPA